MISLEGIVSSAKHVLGEAIKIRSAPKSKPAQGLLVGQMPADVQRGRSGRSSEGGKLRPEASPPSRPADGSPWSNAPIVATLAHAFDGARHRLFGSGTAMTSEAEPMVLHREVPSAEPHLARDAGACGLCISYERQGQRAFVEMAVPCAGCGRGRGHDRDCGRVLAEHNIGDSDWETLPGQGPTFDEWASDNERRGYLQ
jgi:hypothetical protein